MKYKVEARYSTGLIVKTTLRYLIKAMGWSFYAAMGLSLAIAIYLYLSGNNTVLLAVFSGVSVFGILVFLRMFAHYFSGANGEFRKMEGDTVTVTFRENGISFNSENDSVRWKDLFKVWSTEEAYLFFRTKDSYIICPRTGWGDEVTRYIDSKLNEFRISRQ